MPRYEVLGVLCFIRNYFAFYVVSCIVFWFLALFVHFPPVMLIFINSKVEEVFDETSYKSPYKRLVFLTHNCLVFRTCLPCCDPNYIHWANIAYSQQWVHSSSVIAITLKPWSITIITSEPSHFLPEENIYVTTDNTVRGLLRKILDNIVSNPQAIFIFTYKMRSGLIFISTFSKSIRTNLMCVKKCAKDSVRICEGVWEWDSGRWGRWMPEVGIRTRVIR